MKSRPFFVAPPREFAPAAWAARNHTLPKNSSTSVHCLLSETIQTCGKLWLLTIFLLCAYWGGLINIQTSAMLCFSMWVIFYTWAVLLLDILLGRCKTDRLLQLLFQLAKCLTVLTSSTCFYAGSLYLLLHLANCTLKTNCTLSHPQLVMSFTQVFWSVLGNF